MKLRNILFLFLICFNASAQDLLQERIRKVSQKKVSVYRKGGIFHNGSINQKAVLKAIRHHFSAKKGYERIVFDFVGEKVPRVYGHIDSNKKKIFIDFFDTSMDSKMASFGESRYVENFDFFPISKESLSVEVSLKSSFAADVFYLEKPGRFIIDVKN
ncbi:MAG: hypothetical protein ACO20H_00440 [Bacteriovoracaceae bacterium]